MKRVSQAAVDLSGRFIRWPNGEYQRQNITNQRTNLPVSCFDDILLNIFTANEKQAIRTSFEDEGGFPGVIGLIDGTHIRIRAPEDDPDA